MKKLLAALLCALLLAGCASAPEKTAPPPAKSAETVRPEGAAGAPSDPAAGPQETEEWDPEVSQRALLTEAGSLCGTAYLAYVPPEAGDLRQNQAERERLLRESGYEETFPFLADLPEEQVVCAGGEELYLILPGAGTASVAVNEWVCDESNGYVGEAGRALYRSDRAAPFLLQCNVSDIVANSQVVITADDGETLTWTPCRSLRDGTVVTVSEGKFLVDFTRYPEGWFRCDYSESGGAEGGFLYLTLSCDGETAILTGREQTLAGASERQAAAELTAEDIRPLRDLYAQQGMGDWQDLPRSGQQAPDAPTVSVYFAAEDTEVWLDSGMDLPEGGEAALAEVRRLLRSWAGWEG